VESRDWDQRWRERAHERRLEPAEPLVAEASRRQPGRALDLACGAGRNAVWLAKRGWRVTAVDFSAVALERARELATEREVEVEWVLTDLRAYEPARDAFDLVLVLYLHLPAAERRLVLSRAAAAVAPGGTFLLLGHDLANLDSGAPGPSDPAVLYTSDDIVRELPGLRVVRAERVHRAVTVDGREALAVDALVRAVPINRGTLSKWRHAWAAGRRKARRPGSDGGFGTPASRPG
jgi:SAM-dependent methyltransferase